MSHFWHTRALITFAIQYSEVMLQVYRSSNLSIIIIMHFTIIISERVNRTIMPKLSESDPPRL